MVIHSPQAGGSAHPRQHHMMLEFIIVILDSGSICVLLAWGMSAEGPSWGFMVPFDPSRDVHGGWEVRMLYLVIWQMNNFMTRVDSCLFEAFNKPNIFSLRLFFIFNLCRTSSQTQDLLQCSASTLPLSLAQPSSSGQLGPAAHCEHATTANESILHSYKKPLKYWVKTVLPCQTPAQCHLLFFQQVAEGSNSEKWTVIF